MESLKKKTVFASIWSIAGFGAQNVLRLLANLLLTRLLVPEMFGTMAIVQVFIVGLALFSDIGIGPSLIQNTRRDDPYFYNTAWTIQVIRGTLLWLGSLIIASPVAGFYENQQLQLLIPVVGCTPFIAGFQSTALHILNRQLQLRKLILLELVAQVIGLTVMIVWAFFDRTIWALVAGGIVASIIKTFLSHFQLSGHINRFVWDNKASKELFSFGKWIFLSTATTFLAGQADRMILGKLFSLKMLGVYTIAVALSELPKQVISQLGGRVIFPLATHFSNKPRDEFKEKIIKKRWILLGGLAFVLTLIACFGDWVVIFLYDDRYIDAAGMLPLLALGVWPFVLYSSLDSCLLAIGKAHYKAMGNTAQFLYMLLALPVFFHIAGVVGVIIALSLKEIPAYLWVAWGGQREGLSCIRQDMIATLLLGALLALFIFLRHSLGAASPFHYLSIGF